MKISITTIRDLPDELYWDWVEVTLEAFRKVGAGSFTKEHFEQLLREGKFKVTDTHEKTGTVTTIYEILDMNRAN